MITCNDSQSIMQHIQSKYNKINKLNGVHPQGTMNIKNKFQHIVTITYVSKVVECQTLGGTRGHITRSPHSRVPPLGNRNVLNECVNTFFEFKWEFLGRWCQEMHWDH